MRLLTFLLSLLLSYSRVTAALPGNIVSNGDFEIWNGVSFPPWQFSQGFDAWIGGSAGGSAASGRNCVFVGGNTGGNMWQILSTQIGQAYRLSFYERGDDPQQTQRISLLNVYWGNQEVASFIETNKMFGWNYHVYTVTADSSNVNLFFQNDCDAIGTFGIPGVDGVSVIAIPEPSFAACLVGAGLALYTRNRVRAWTLLSNRGR